MQTHVCPICSKNPVIHQARYPKAVCRSCADQACDAQGRPLILASSPTVGGFSARVAETGEAYPSHVCYIGEATCWADEAYLGSIVIQPHDGNPFKPIPENSEHSSERNSEDSSRGDAPTEEAATPACVSAYISAE